MQNFAEGVYKASREGCGVDAGEPILEHRDNWWKIVIPEGKTAEWALYRFLLLPGDFVVYALPGEPNGISIGFIKLRLRGTILTSASYIGLEGVVPNALSWFNVLLPWELEEAAEEWVKVFYSYNSIPDNVGEVAKWQWKQSKSNEGGAIVTFAGHPEQGKGDPFDLVISMEKIGAHWRPRAVVIDDRVWRFDPEDGAYPFKLLLCS